MPIWMKHLVNGRVFEAANEGKPGGDQAAENANVSDAAAAKAVEEAKEAADKAAKAAAEDTSDPKLQALAAEKAELLREVMDKKTKLTAAKADLDAAKKALEAYNGIDPEKVKELIRKETEAEQRDALARGDFERVKAMMAEEHEKALKKVRDDLEAERAGRQADLSLIDELTIGNSFGNSEFIRDSMLISPAKARALYGAHFDRQNGVVVAYDKKAGEKDRTMLVNAKGEPLSFEEALNRLVEADPDKKGLLKSKAKPGASSASDLDKAKKQAPTVKGAARIAATLGDLV